MSRAVVTSLYCHNRLISLVMLDCQRKPLMHTDVTRREIWEWSDHTHLTDPQRLSRLFIASCLAHIWLGYVGSLCQKDGWQKIMHRRKRCDLSLFQLGVRLLEHFLNEELPIPVQFHVII